MTCNVACSLATHFKNITKNLRNYFSKSKFLLERSNFVETGAVLKGPDGSFIAIWLTWKENNSPCAEIIAR